jgi:hypothetical protein
MNPYKAAWHANTQKFVVRYAVAKAFNPRPQKPQDLKWMHKTFHPSYREPAKKFSPLDSIINRSVGNAIAGGSVIALKHLAQNQLKGNIGIAGRTVGRVGGRFVPIVGAAMLAHDAWKVYKFFTD